MNTLTPIAPSFNKANRLPSKSQVGYARLLAPTIRPNEETRVRVTKTQAERLLTGAMKPTASAFALLTPRARATRRQIESAVLSFLFVSIAITFGLLMTA